ncbi:MAG: FkbM family methyltransferase [Sphingomicrobium sp.]
MRIAASPDAQLKYLAGRFDEDLIELARRSVSPGMIVWDIGANCGTFAFSCDLAAQVVAVEADPFLVTLLRRSAAGARVPVSVLEAAVSDTVGTAEFSVAARGRASNHLTVVAGYSQSGGERSRVEVRTVTLDSMIDEWGRPDFIKMDIEGAEQMALKGAERLLSEVRPAIYLEVSDETQASLRTTLEQAHYAIEERGGNWLAVPMPGASGLAA